jgi:spore maturation protein CgeB
MFRFFSQLFSSKTKSAPKVNSKQDVEFAFKMHDMVKAINSSSKEDKLKSLETLRIAGHITEEEFRAAKEDLAF